MVIERRAAQISGHSSEIEAPASPIEGRALFIGKPTLDLERASLRIERSSLRPIPPSLLIRRRACHPERRAGLCTWRSAIVRHPRVAKDLLFSGLCRSSICLIPVRHPTRVQCILRVMSIKTPVVHSDPDILGGTPVFIGTRVPVQALFDYLEGGDTLD